jgi:hypothetical protein
MPPGRQLGLLRPLRVVSTAPRLQFLSSPLRSRIQPLQIRTMSEIKKVSTTNAAPGQYLHKA